MNRPLFAGYFDQGHTLTDLNSRLATALEEEGENLLKVLRAAIDAEKLYTVVCPKRCCQTGAKFSAPFPDINVMLNAAKWWTEYVHGKASSKPQVPTTDPRAVHKAVEAMTDEELAGYLDANGATAEDVQAVSGSSEAVIRAIP